MMLSIFTALAAFAILHSLTAGRFKPVFRQRFGERVYEGLYRALYNIFSLISFLPVIIVLMTTPSQVVWLFPEAFSPVLLAIQLVGLVGLGLSLVQIDFLRFAGLRQLWAYLNGKP